MKTLQEVFDQELKNLFKPEKLGTELVQQKLEEIGIEASEFQLKEIKKIFKQSEDDTLHLEFEDDQIFDAGFESKEQFEKAFQSIFTELTNDLEKMTQNFSEELPSIMQETTDHLSQKILNDLKQDAQRMIKERAADFSSFEASLHNTYQEAFDLLEMLIAISLEAGEAFSDINRNEAFSENDFIFDVLTRLHARACQISYEIIVLLKSGLADGAHARWRSLHEISVTAIFIGSNGNDLAERYLLHDEVESYKACKIYQENFEKLGYEPLSKEEVASLQYGYESLIKRFGDNYRFDYGWASTVINKDKPTFRDIEKFAGLNHLRPFYKMACNNVHANPKGIFFKLGLYPDSGDILLAGPSNAGLTDPGQLTALSLTQTTTTLLTHRPNIDCLVACKIMMALEREIGEAFLKAENSIGKFGKLNKG